MPKVHYLKGALAGGVLAALGGFLAPAALAAPSAPAPPGPGNALPATLSHSGTGSAAVWDGPDAVELTVGSETASTYAQLTITDPPRQAPATEPSFTTDNYAAGSPRWVITFSNSCYIFVYPTGTGQFTPAAQNAEVGAWRRQLHHLASGVRQLGHRRPGGRGWRRHRDRCPDRR